jgi:CubicO group peptidase (beta-lactamase class C family)
MKRPLFLALIAFSLFAAQPDPKKAGLDPQQLAKIPARMKEFVDRGELSGAVTLVARHGVLGSLDAVGWQNVEEKKPMRVDTVFQVMSMTKPFTGVGIMMLVEEGRLRITDPVEKHLPEFRGQMVIESRTADTRVLAKPSRPITIFDLMTHTSGMSGGPPEGIKDVLQKMDLPLAQAVAIYSQQPLDFEPGTKWQYSNTGLATLGRIIEAASGQPYEKFLENRIFRPLGMKDSFIFPPQDKLSRVAMVYKFEDGKLQRSGSEILGGDPATFRKGARYSGPEYALCTTAQDLFAFYQMMLNGGAYNGQRLLSRASVDAMTKVHTGNLKAGHNPGTAFGLTWEVVKDSVGLFGLLSQDTFGHGGAFGTHGWIDRAKDLVGVFLIQSARGPANDAKYAFMAMANAAVE